MPGYFYIMVFMVCCTVLGCLVHDALLYLFRSIGKYLNFDGDDAKKAVAYVLFLEFAAFVLIVSAFFMVYLLRI